MQKAGCCSHLTCGHRAFIFMVRCYSQYRIPGLELQSINPDPQCLCYWGQKVCLEILLGKCQAMSYMWWNDMETMILCWEQNGKIQNVNRFGGTVFSKAWSSAHNTKKKNHLHLFCLRWSHKQQADIFCLLSSTYWCVAHSDENILWQRHQRASLHEQNTILCRSNMV